jgi:hypothetical protein
MPDAAKKIIWSLVLSIPSAIFGLVIHEVLQAWGVFSPFSEWLGGWLKMHVSPTQAGWTIAGIIALTAYAMLLWFVWSRHRIPQVADIIQGATRFDAPDNPIESNARPLQIELGNDDKYERLQDINGIVRRAIHISVFNGGLDDIPDCNLKLIAATPRPNTGDNPANFPIYFSSSFDLRGKQRKFIQIVMFAENPGNASILERDNVIISAASGGYFPGWTTVPICPKDNPAILTLEAFAPGITPQTAHLHIWVDQRRLYAKIV